MNVWASPSPHLPVMKNKQESNDSKSPDSATKQLSYLGFKSFAKIRDAIYSLMNIYGKSGLLWQTGTKLSFLPLNTFQICWQSLVSAGDSPNTPNQPLLTNEVSSTGLSGVHSTFRKKKKMLEGSNVPPHKPCSGFRTALYITAGHRNGWRTLAWSITHPKSGRGTNLTALTSVSAIRDRNTCINLETEVSVGVVEFGKSKRFYKNLQRLWSFYPQVTLPPAQKHSDSLSFKVFPNYYNLMNLYCLTVFYRVRKPLLLNKGILKI